MENLIGTDVGRYHIVEQIGEGGMATVFKAYDNRLDRHVAMKFIRRELVGEAFINHVIKRFEREAKSLAKLSHANIVKIHDYGEYNGSPYLVMEYLEGNTLKSRLGKPIHYVLAAQLTIPIARALGYAHKENIIHRDVKPANVLFNKAGDTMLSDFGIAKILDVDDSSHLTSMGSAIGTPAYMSPEQGQGLDIDHRSDVYSLGVIFFEMVTGRVPFKADTPLAVILKQSQEPLPHPRSFIPSLPEAVEQVIFKVLAKNPSERYQDMEAFTAALEKLITLERIGKAAGDAYSKEMETMDSISSPTQPKSAQKPILLDNSKVKKIKFSSPLMIVSLGLAGIMVCLLVALGIMAAFQICPPQGPYIMPPWCAEKQVFIEVKNTPEILITNNPNLASQIITPAITEQVIGIAAETPIEGSPTVPLEVTNTTGNVHGKFQYSGKKEGSIYLVAFTSWPPQGAPVSTTIIIGDEYQIDLDPGSYYLFVAFNQGYPAKDDPKFQCGPFTLKTGHDLTLEPIKLTDANVTLNIKPCNFISQ